MEAPKDKALQTLTKTPSEQFSKNISVRNFKDIVSNQDLKPVSAMIREGNEAIPKTILSGIITDIFTFYAEQINFEKVKELCEVCISQGYMLNGLDYRLFKSKCLSGSYELKFRLTPHVFVDWFKTYIWERSEAFAASNSQKKPEKVSEYSNKTLTLLKRFADRKKEIIEKKPEPESEYNQKLKAKFNEVLNEFRSKCKTSNGIEFVEVNGRFLDINEYLKLRFKK